MTIEESVKQKLKALADLEIEYSKKRNIIMEELHEIASEARNYTELYCFAKKMSKDQKSFNMIMMPDRVVLLDRIHSR